MVAKSFEQTSRRDVVDKWLTVLAEELAVRMADDASQFERHPRTFTLYYRCERESRH